MTSLADQEPPRQEGPETDTEAEASVAFDPGGYARQIQEWMAEGDSERLGVLIDELHAADLADIIEIIPGEERMELVLRFRHRMDADVFSYLRDDVQREVVQQLKPKEVAAIVDALSSDDALHLIEDLDEDFQRAILRKLSGRVRALVEQGLTFPEDSAGRLIQREVVAFPQFWTVGKLIDYLRAEPEGLPETFYSMFVVDPMHKVSGVVNLSKVLQARRSHKLIDIADMDFEKIQVEMDQEEVAYRFHQYGLVEAPVVDEDGRLLGVITIDDIVDVINEEAEEDILALAGVASSDIFRAVLETTRARFSWLFVNLITAIVSSVVIGLFEATIDQVVALAVLMPIVASMGGNAGTQALTVAVRGLATKELTGANTWRVIGKETTVGIINGTLFALLIGVVTFFWFKSAVLGMVISAAMIINLLAAGFFGAVIPVVLDRLKIDPAVSSAVFLTTVTDVVGFLAFLGLASIFLL